MGVSDELQQTVGVRECHEILKYYQSKIQLFKLLLWWKGAGGCQPLAVSYCAFPSPTCSLHWVKGLQPCIEETLLVIGFFAKIVGSEERQAGAEKRGGRAANCPLRPATVHFPPDEELPT